MSDEPTKVGELDMNDRGVRAMLAARWPISADKRKDYLNALHEALVIARKDKKVRAITSCLRAITALEAQNQADEHLEIKGKQIEDSVVMFVKAIERSAFDGA